MDVNGGVLELLDGYSDLKLGFVDAVLMAQAERHNARIAVTTDARDFRAVKLASLSDSCRSTVEASHLISKPVAALGACIS